MADNLKQLEQDIDIYIDPNGAPQSILAQNHNSLLKQAVSKAGKYVGASYVAYKNIIGVLSNGQFSFEGNSLDQAGNFTLAFSKLNADNIDLIETISKLVVGSVIVFKDFSGKSAQYKYISYEFDVVRNAYLVSVESFNGNPSYTYQDTESNICVFSMISRSSNFQVLNGAEFRVLKKSTNLKFHTVELDDIVVNGYLENDNALITYGVFKNNLSDNDINNFGTLAGNFNDGNYSSVKVVKFS